MASYPAGFLYVFSILSWLTQGGRDLVTAQYIFGGLYFLTLLLVLDIYWLIKVLQFLSCQLNRPLTLWHSCLKDIFLYLSCQSEYIPSIYSDYLMIHLLYFSRCSPSGLP